MYLDSSTRPYISIQAIGPTSVSQVRATNGLSTSTWSHVVISQDSNSLRMWINGTEETTSIVFGVDTAWFSSITGTAERFSVGGSDSSLSTGDFSGAIDDFRYYRHPLSQAQVTQIYNSGNGTESFAVDTITVPSTQAVADGNSVLLLNCNTIDESLNKNIPVYNGPSGIGSNFGAFTGSDGALVLDGVNQYLRAPSQLVMTTLFLVSSVV
jgi:hypothetical protein